MKIDSGYHQFIGPPHYLKSGYEVDVPGSSFSTIMSQGLYAGGWLVRASDFPEPVLSYAKGPHWQASIRKLGIDLNGLPGPALEIPTLQLSTITELEIVGGVLHPSEVRPNLLIGDGGWCNRSTFNALRIRGLGAYMIMNASHLRLEDLNLESATGWKTRPAERCRLIIQGPGPDDKHGRGPLTINNAGMEDAELHIRDMDQVLITRGQFNTVRIVLDNVRRYDIDDLIHGSVWHGSSEIWVNGKRVFFGSVPATVHPHKALKDEVDHLRAQTTSNIDRVLDVTEALTETVEAQQKRIEALEKASKPRWRFW